MPNKKKKQRNGFYYFMKEMLEDMQRKGKTEYNMQNIAPLAHPEWKNLSQEEKDIYNDIAKRLKQEAKDSVDGKMDCTGLYLKDILEDERIKVQKNNEKLILIKSKIAELMNPTAITNEKFHIISFNIFCLTEENEYVPAEVGLVEYSIAKGIIREYHEFIDPGEIPLGYTYSSIQHSEDTHKIPPQNFALSSKNYMYIYKSIKSFINSHANKPVVYCFPDETEQVEGVLSWLQLRSLTQGDEFQVFDLAALLMQLRLFANSDFAGSLVMAKDILTKNVFDYVPNISCQWHEEMDVPNHCALGIAKRYCFLMSDYLCKPYGIEMIPNKHVPLRDESENISVVDPAMLKLKTSSRPLPSRSSPVMRPVTPEKTQTIVSDLPSKFKTEEEKSFIAGAERRAYTEILKNQPSSSHLVYSPSPSAASRLRGNENFELADEDFPELGNLAIGRGRGRGLFSTERPEPTKLAAAGLGRGCIWKTNK